MEYFAACSVWGALAGMLAWVGVVLFTFGHGKGGLANVGLAFFALCFGVMAFSLFRWAQFYREGLKYRRNGKER